MNDVKKKLLIFDLDETLIFSDTECLERNEDFTVGKYYVYKRPGLDEFIKFSLENFDVAVWTSSTSEYADKVTKEIFINPGELKFIWSRERCTQKFDFERHAYYWLKNLQKVKKAGYALESVIMIDDTPDKLERNYGNLIIVAPYTGQTVDDELKFLKKYLTALKNVMNVRDVEKRGWKSKFPEQIVRKY